MKTKRYRNSTAVLILSGLALLLRFSANAATVIYADSFTLSPSSLPYGQSYGTLPANAAPPGATALQWAKTTRSNFPGKFIVADLGGAHGGVLGADNSATNQLANYASNLDLSIGSLFDNGNGNLLWSISFDLYRFNATNLWFTVLANYNDATGKGLGVQFSFANGTVTFVQDGVASASLGNPGLILGNNSWASFVFERYADGTLHVKKTSGGGTTALDATLSLTNPSYSTGGTVALSFISNTTAANPLYVDNLAVTMDVVPEPSSLALLAAGGAGLCLLARRRRPVQHGCS